MSRRRKRLWIIGAGLAAVVVWLAWPQKVSPPPFGLPSPNGYELIAAAEGKLVLYEGEMPIPSDKALAWVRRNQQVLVQVRKGLILPCAAPPVLGLAPDKPPLGASRSYWRTFLPALFFAEGKGREMANHLELAVSSYIDLIKLGAAVMPNGVVEHLYIGMSCIEVGATNLLPLAYRLAPADCRAIAEELTRVARKIPPPQEAIRREWETFERRFSPRRTLVVRVQRWFPRSRFNQVDARIRADGEASRQLLEKTIRAFAARADESPEAVKK